MGLMMHKDREIKNKVLIDVTHMLDVTTFSGIQRVVYNISEYSNETADFMAVVETRNKIKLLPPNFDLATHRGNGRRFPAFQKINKLMRKIQSYLTSKNMHVSEKILRKMYETWRGFIRAIRTRRWESISKVSNSVLIIANPVHDSKKLVFWSRFQKDPTNKLAVVIHDLLPIHYPELFPLSRIHSFQRYLDFAMTAEILFFVSEKSKSEFQNLMGSRTSQSFLIVTPDGLKPTNLSDSNAVNEPTERVNILCVSTFEPRKNHLVLIDACSILWKQGIEFTLTLAGASGWSNVEIHSRISECIAEFPGQISIFENPSDSILRNLYEGSTFCVYPATDEGFGIPVIESIAFKKKIITNRIPAVDLLDLSDVILLDGTLENLVASLKLGCEIFPDSEIVTNIEMRPIGKRIFDHCEKFISID